MTGTATLLKEKKVLITGASRGIGAAIAEAYAQEGAHLILVSNDPKPLEEVAEKCRGVGAFQVDIIECDLLEAHNVNDLAATALDKFKHIDVLVNNAGYLADGLNPLEGSPDEWDKMVKLHLSVPMRLTRLLAPSMCTKSGCAIINIASTAAQRADADEASYAASKWGLRGWSASCYQALRPKGVKVMCICPSLVESEIGLKAAEMKGKSDEDMIQPQDVAEVALLPWRLSGHAVPVEITLGVAACSKET